MNCKILKRRKINGFGRGAPVWLNNRNAIFTYVAFTDVNSVQIVIQSFQNDILSVPHYFITILDNKNGVIKMMLFVFFDICSLFCIFCIKVLF